jgi:drug/metabolite transporter (DMT)-like permease
MRRHRIPPPLSLVFQAMEKVFSRAALFAVALLVATAGLGLWLGDLHGQVDPRVLRWGTVHRLSGVLAALTVVLVNSMAVTYFIGTGRWCREVVETYGLDAAYIEQSRRLKRAAFPFALLGMLGVVAIVALGGAADPASGRPGTQDWVTPHLVGGLALVGAIAWCFQAQLPNMRRQHELIESVLGDVRAVRKARGLDVEERAPNS